MYTLNLVAFARYLYRAYPSRQKEKSSLGAADKTRVYVVVGLGPILQILEGYSPLSCFPTSISGNLGKTNSFSSPVRATMILPRTA